VYKSGENRVCYKFFQNLLPERPYREFLFTGGHFFRADFTDSAAEQILKPMKFFDSRFVYFGSLKKAVSQANEKENHQA
jgi:hypothetical protein